MTDSERSKLQMRLQRWSLVASDRNSLHEWNFGRHRRRATRTTLHHDARAVDENDDDGEQEECGDRGVEIVVPDHLREVAART